jgi:cytochrome c-type biogenesis protein CcmH
MSLTRRSFIKQTAAATAALAAGVALPVLGAGANKATVAIAQADVTWSKAPCRFCGTGCGVSVGVKAGRVVATQGDPLAEVNRGLNSDSIASANEGRLDGRASEEIAAALAIDSADPKALALAASAAFEAGRYAGAIGYWRRLLATLEANSPIAVQARKNIDETVGLSAVTVDIRLADGARVASDAAVIVTARTKGAASSTGTTNSASVVDAANATSTLLAERRLSASELPTTIVLDDSLAINPADTLSAYPQVVVEARIVSTSGGDDLTGRSDAKGTESRRANVVIAAPSL